MITLVIFSKDRAMQLDSLLQSVRDFCVGVDTVSVIAKATTGLHALAYKRLMDADTCVTEFALSDSDGGLPLGAEVAHNAADAEHIALAVDDMLFYRPSDFARAVYALTGHNAFVWSWRLGQSGLATPWCMLPHDAGHWLCSPLVDDPDYRYFFHSDGAIYRTADYTNMLDKWLPYWKTSKYTPNDLEAAVAMRRDEWAPLVGPHLGPLQPTCITWQLNRVQTKYGSPAAEIPETNVDTLAQAYLDGKRVNNEILYAMLQADAFQFNPPGARPTHVYAGEKASKVWASCIE